MIRRKKIVTVSLVILSLLLVSQIAMAASNLSSATVVLGYPVRVRSQSMGIYNFKAGLFRLVIDGIQYEGYCIDLNHRIGTGPVNLLSAPDTQAFRTIAYIVTWYHPPATGFEAASIQGAIWRALFPLPYGIIYPSSVVTRLNQIYNDALGKDVVRAGDSLSLSASPSTSFTLTATLTPAREGVKIIFSTTEVGASFDNNIAFTNSSGKATVTYYGEDVSQVTAYTKGAWPTWVDIINSRYQDLIRIEPPVELTATTEIPPAQTYSISGYKFNDMNNNTIFDPDESGIPGWEIQLWNASGLLETTTTNSTGYYEFTGLEAGSYKVKEILTDGWKNTTLIEIEVVLPGSSISGNVSDVDFGNFELGVKGGYKWEDLNGDGKWDVGEHGLKNWEIKLYKWIEGTWVYQSSEFTDQNGNYTFTGLTAGKYKVEEELQDGWIQTYPKEPPYYEFTVISGFRDLDNNFGNFEERTVKKTFELTLISCHPWTSLKYYGAVRLAGSQDGWTSVELIRVGTSLLWKGTIDNLKPGEYEWRIYTIYNEIEIILKSGQEVISEDKVNSFTFGKTSLEVWKTVDKVEKLDGSYKVTGKIYIKNNGSYGAYILSIEDFVKRRDGSNWVKFANGVILDFSPGHIIPPGETHTFDYYVIITFPTLVPIKPLSSALGNQGFTGFCCCPPPTDQWKNVVKVTLFNHPLGIHIYTYRISFSLPK
ncbi:MAG: SdrD B-like domain-containing protein [Nitrososphaerales archaeon]